MDRTISPGMLKRLQTLYGYLHAHIIDTGVDERAARLAWASQLVGRPIASFKDLNQAEARQLIDTVQGQLGIPETQRPGRPHKRLDRIAAQKAGTEGRHDNQTNETTLASKADLARIQYALDKLGWRQEQLDGWLRSPNSPLKKSNPRIVTLADANRVWWGLKRILMRRGLWTERAK